MSTEIDATYRVVTPLFCVGADPNRPELRLPGFKGVLRFWWRALAWQRCGGVLDEIRHQEDALFGSAGAGRSRVSMRLAEFSASPKVSVGAVLETDGHVVGKGARYLGYGVMEAFASRRRQTSAGQLTRACFRTPFDFTVRMRGRDLSATESASVTDALKAVGILGGMGARSRKGYGSLALRSLRVDGREQWQAPRSETDLRDAVAAFRPHGIVPTALPEFTALSGEARHVLLSSSRQEPIALLDLIGRELVRFRSWGRNGKILGGALDSERNFKDDHDLMKGAMKDRPPKTHPRRIAFGLPHNYGKEQVKPGDKHLDRRASPLFIHIHECGGAPVAVLSFLPARFLPKGRSTISVGRNRVQQCPEERLYRPIHDFLDRILDPTQRKEPFTNAIEVKS